MENREGVTAKHTKTCTLRLCYKSVK